MLRELLAADVMSAADAAAITGGLSTTSKMPCASYSLPAAACGVGSRMRDAGRDYLASLPSKSRSMPGAIRAGHAGKLSPCTGCYARKGNYARPNVAAVLARRLESITHPMWVDAMVVLIAADGREYFRWHDSGDLQSVDHLRRIAEIARRLPHVLFWLPTQERRMLRDYAAEGGTIPANLTVRVSAPLMNHAPAPGAAWAASYVTTSGDVADDVHLCPASRQDNACGSCRACWSDDVRVVAYPIH